MRYLTILVVSALLLVVQQMPNQDGLVEGDAESAQGKAFDRRRNRDDLPTENRIEPDTTLAAMLAPGDDEGRFHPHPGTP